MGQNKSHETSFEHHITGSSLVTIDGKAFRVSYVQVFYSA